VGIIGTFFTPFATIVTNITNANPAVVTTLTDNGYASNLFIRIVLPLGNIYGMPEVNGNVYKVTPITSNTFSIGIDSTNFETFHFPPYALGVATQIAQAIPVSESGYVFNEAVINDRTATPEYGWTNTTFPWVNNPNHVSP
jgi:hypothetical protein